MIMKTVCAAALLLGWATAQPGTASSQVPKECFAQSRVAYGGKGQTKFSHQDELMTNGNFNKDTRVSQITACNDLAGRLSRLQVTLKDFVTQKLHPLTNLGGPEQIDEKCTSIDLNAGDLITSVIIGFDSRGVPRITLVWQKSGVSVPITTSIGNQAQQNDTILFNSVNQLVGFYGESSLGSSIKNLGVIVYRPACGDKAAGVLPTTTPSDSNILVPTNDLNTQEAKKITLQFITFNLFNSKPQQTSTVVNPSQETEFTPVEDTTSEEDKTDNQNKTIIIAVVVPVVVVIMIVVACILFCRVVKKRNLKKNSVETEKSFFTAENAETPRFFREDNDLERNSEPKEHNGVAGISLRNQCPFNNEIRVEEQHEARPFRVSPKCEGDADAISIPEATHPLRTSGLQINPNAEEDCTGVNTHRESFCPGPDIVDIQEDSHHPAVLIAYHDEESSMPALNLNSNASSSQKQVREEVGILPKIGQRNVQQVLMDTTPDTAGVAKRRFQEIIDSDDETNGNGSRVQRFQKKFKNTRDVFGEESSKAIHFSTEKEQTEKGELKKSNEKRLNSLESQENLQQSGKITKQSLGQQKKTPAIIQGVKKGAKKFL